jgi:hypothetical protein
MMMSDWREAHRKELLEKQRHISQKLAQLRELRALIEKWRRIMNNYKEWLGGLEEGAEDSKWFSLQSMIRMGTITGQLNQLIGEFEQIGDPKTMGSGTVSTSGTSSVTSGTGANQASMTVQERAAATAEVLSAKAGPLASMAPWELVWHIDPATSESIRQGEMGAAITNVILNPFTSLAGMGFAKEIAKESISLFEEHPEEFEALEKGWKDTEEALNSITETLNEFDLEELDEIEEGLEDTLRGYEQAYDGAQGVDNTSAQQLHRAASGQDLNRYMN